MAEESTKHFCEVMRTGYLTTTQVDIYLHLGLLFCTIKPCFCTNPFGSKYASKVLEINVVLIPHVAVLF